MANRDQAQLTAGRIIRATTATVSASPTDASTEPHITLSPEAGSAMPTTGFFLGLKSPTAPTGIVAAVPPAGGFNVTIWVRNPTTKAWFSSVTKQMGYNEAWVCWGVDAAELYFQVENASTPGYVDIHVAEQ